MVTRLLLVKYVEIVGLALTLRVGVWVGFITHYSCLGWLAGLSVY